MVLLEGLALEFRIYFNSLACLAVFFFFFLHSALLCLRKVQESELLTKELISA